MQTPRKNTQGSLVPFVIAVVVAVVGTVAMFVLELGSRDEVASGIGMVTSAAADRAGATARPTVDNVVTDQSRSSLFRIVR